MTTTFVFSEYTKFTQHVSGRNTERTYTYILVSENLEDDNNFHDCISVAREKFLLFVTIITPYL